MSLAQLAASRLPIRQILEKGLLTAPFDEDILRAIGNRITFENLIGKDLFTDELDSRLLVPYLVKNQPGLIWLYLSEMDDIPLLNPLSEEGLRLANQFFGWNRTEATQAVFDAVDDIYLDILDIYRHEGNFYNFGSFGIVWERKADSYYLYIIRYTPLEYIIDGTEQLYEEIVLTSFDDLIFTIVSRLFIDELQQTLTLEPNYPNELSDVLRNGFHRLTTQTNQDYWLLLHNSSIVIDQPFDLSLAELAIHNPVILRVLAGHLYIFRSEQQPLYYPVDDARLILNSLQYNPRKWRVL